MKGRVVAAAVPAANECHVFRVRAVALRGYGIPRGMVPVQDDDGLRYDKSALAVATFSIILQLTAIPVIFIANKPR